MGFCVINICRQQVAWCSVYSSACRMAQEFGCDTKIIETQSKIHRKFVAQIRQSWS